MEDRHASRNGNRCFKTGVWGAIIAAVCCGTPVLAVTLASMGLVAVVPKLDYVLLSALLIFVLLAAYGWRKRRTDRDHVK